MKLWTIWVDTSEKGFIKLSVRADSKAEALGKFERYCKGKDFREKYGYLDDFKRGTIEEVDDG